MQGDGPKDKNEKDVYIFFTMHTDIHAVQIQE